MKNELIKFIRDTLQESGKYSSNKTMIAQAFLLCAWAFIYQTIKSGNVPIDMFNTFAGLAFGTAFVKTTAGLISKQIDTKSPEEVPSTTIETTIKKTEQL
jgi:hypothetical protein